MIRPAAPNAADSGIAQPPCLPCAPVFGYITGQDIGP